ncbi:cutinase [Coprinopsis marcescibilis]|uniref:cutinase n=1 Tax=Coprinopsis marcescibilis TaxID=230819 RepID=A0A5C3LFT6_COPMA|nr:cutinase [Coprinopsis marcescibilis]
MIKSALLFFALAVTATLTRAASSSLEGRQLACNDTYVYFARGTAEPGTLGLVVGPGFKNEISLALLGKTTLFEGINYPALPLGYFSGGDRRGAKAMADNVSLTAFRCPKARIFISGYSQGAQVTHLAARQLSTSDQDRVTGVVTFGDPYRDTPLPGVLQSRRKTYCNAGDLVCDGLPLILGPHLAYGRDLADAANWIAARV